MKKAEVVGNQQLTPEVEARFAAMETRQAAIEARLEMLDPTPKLETLQPYLVGTQVYSVADLEGRHPLIVRGYDRPGFVLLTVLPSEPDRSLPLQSVRPLEQCPRAQSTPAQRFARMDPKTRAFYEGRETARVAAITAPFVPPIPEQKRYS
jgi:hypothetical protein